MMVKSGLYFFLFWNSPSPFRVAQSCHHSLESLITSYFILICRSTSHGRSRASRSTGWRAARSTRSTPATTTTTFEVGETARRPLSGLWRQGLGLPLQRVGLRRLQRLFSKVHHQKPEICLQIFWRYLWNWHVHEAKMPSVQVYSNINYLFIYSPTI